MPAKRRHVYLVEARVGDTWVPIEFFFFRCTAEKDRRERARKALEAGLRVKRFQVTRYEAVQP